MRSQNAVFPTVVRTRKEILRLAPADAQSVWTLRVQAADIWDSVRVECTPDTTVAQVKAAAMRNLLPDVLETELYIVKFGGAEVRNELTALKQIGARDASMLFLAPLHRRPLR